MKYILQDTMDGEYITTLENRIITPQYNTWTWTKRIDNAYIFQYIYKYLYFIKHNEGNDYLRRNIKVIIKE